MLELKRIYWLRRALGTAGPAAIVWLFSAVLAALWNPVLAGQLGAGVSDPTEIFVRLGLIAASAAALPAGVIVVLVLGAAVLQGRDVRRRDPVRIFRRHERGAGMARAHGQCELDGGFGRRCQRPAEQGDHFFPWSKGGASSLENFVAACARCNRAKGARIPSPGLQRRISRRRGYFPADADTAVGQRRALPGERVLTPAGGERTY